MFRVNSEKFQNIFKPKLSFLMENQKNDNKSEFMDFNEFTLYVYDFSSKRKLRLKMKILKFPGIHPNIRLSHFFMLPFFYAYAC